MPVAVSLPTRIRVDRRALLERPDWIDAALSAALGRAIENSRRVVLDPRGGYLDVTPLPPQISWTGLPVDSELRVAFERRITELYGSLLVGQGIGEIDFDVPEVIPPDPSEPYDASRAFRIGGSYLLDSYDGGVEPVSLTFEPLIVGGEEVVRVVQHRHGPEVMVEFESISQEATPEQPLGLIYRVAPGNGVTKFAVLIATGPGRRDGDFAFDGFTKVTYAGPKAVPMFKKDVFVPPPGDGTAKIVDMPNDRAGIKAKYRELVKDSYAAMVRQAPKPVRLTGDAFKKALDAGFETFLDADLSTAPETISKAVLMSMSGAQVLLWGTPQDDEYLKWKGTAQLTPLVETRMRDRSEKKSGKGGGATKATGGTADGRPGGTGLCPPDDDRPDNHPADDIEGSLDDEPFLGEPSLEEIGDAGVTLGEKISALAKKLNIPECKYAGQFCYHAACQLRAEARYTQWMDETATGNNEASVKGNLGALNFTPDQSPIIAKIRELAAIVPVLSDLMRWVEAFYQSQTYRCSIHGIWRGENSTSWVLRFLGEVVPVIKEAVGHMFIGACRSSLLQLLAASLIEIEKRQKAFPRYAPLFERWIVPVIANMAELEIMRRLLRDHKIEKVAKPVMITAGVVTGQAWLATSTALVTTLKGGFTHQAGAAYDFVQDGGEEKIRDRKGRLWSSDDLESAIRLNGQVAEGADPLVKQFTDTPDAMKRLRDTDSIQNELASLLKEMVKNNNEMRDKATNDAMFGLKASRIEENIPTATIPGGKYSLQGIHKIAHEQIGDAFGKTGFYAEGLNDLFDSEEGKAALTGAAILIGMVALSVLVPGGAFIAFAAGGALATHELAGAYEKKRLYRSLINPDLVLTSAEVEVALFVAWFGAVMSAIPEAGTAVKGLVAGGRAIAKGEAKMIGKMAAKSVATRVSKELVEYAAKDLLEAFVKETTIMAVMDQLIPQVMSPLIDRVEHDASLGLGNTGSAGATTQTDEDGGEQEFIDMVLNAEVPD